jgi:hypothetical protein
MSCMHQEPRGVQACRGLNGPGVGCRGLTVEGWHVRGLASVGDPGENGRTLQPWRRLACNPGEEVGEAFTHAWCGWFFHPPPLP